MPDFDITGTLESVEFGAIGVPEILQNVKTILATSRYTVPLDREFGVNLDLIDEPMPRAKAKMTAEIIAAIRKYEPRCTVTSVTFSGDGMDGRLIPKVRVRIND